MSSPAHPLRSMTISKYLFFATFPLIQSNEVHPASSLIQELYAKSWNLKENKAQTSLCRNSGSDEEEGHRSIQRGWRLGMENREAVDQSGFSEEVLPDWMSEGKWEVYHC